MDEIEGGGHDVRLAFHLGPDVVAELDGTSAILSWPGAAVPGAARLELPDGLQWSLHRGETEPILGWYSRGLGRRVPACTLLGDGHSALDTLLTTRLEFLDPRITRPVTEQPYHGYSPKLTAEISKIDGEADEPE